MDIPFTCATITITSSATTIVTAATYLKAPSWRFELVDSFEALSPLERDASGTGSDQRGQSGVALAARQQISRPLIDSIKILVQVFLTLTRRVADGVRQS